jgi:hypothetical protein
VTLVSTVVRRKNAVPPSRRFPLSIPNMTIRPEAMPARQISTCTRVKVDNDMPRIMESLCFEHRYYDEKGETSTERGWGITAGFSARVAAAAISFAARETSNTVINY